MNTANLHRIAYGAWDDPERGRLLAGLQGCSLPDPRRSSVAMTNEIRARMLKLDAGEDDLR